jgi:hypothetical protein
MECHKVQAEVAGYSRPMLSLGSDKGEIELCKSSSHATAQRMHLALASSSFLV